MIPDSKKIVVAFCWDMTYAFFLFFSVARFTPHIWIQQCVVLYAAWLWHFWNYRAQRPFRSQFMDLILNRFILWEIVCLQCCLVSKESFRVKLARRVPYKSQVILEFSVGTLKCLSVDCDLKYEVCDLWCERIGLLILFSECPNLLNIGDPIL